MKNILVLCTGNSCRSQLTHGFLEKFVEGKANIYSAGIETHGLSPNAVKTMAEIGIDISHYTSNNVLEYQNILLHFFVKMFRILFHNYILIHRNISIYLFH